MGQFCRRNPKNMEGFFLLGPLGIMRESARILLLHSSFFTAIALALVYPVSGAAILSHAFVDHGFVTNMSNGIQGIAPATTLTDSKISRMIHLKVAQTIVSYLFCLPFIVTFSLFAKAAAAHTIACIYAGGKPSSHRLVQALPKIWLPLLITYFWICLMILGINVVVLSFLVACTNLLSALGFSSHWVVGASLAGLILYSIVFAHALIICNLATVVTVIEDCYGIAAIYRANILIRGRTQVALLIALMTNLSSAFVESLFQFRVIQNGGSLLGILQENAGLVLCEGSLLIFIYSLVALMDATMSSVFYFTCKSSRLESFWENFSSIIKSVEDEAFSSHSLQGRQKVISKEWVINHP